MTARAPRNAGKSKEPTSAPVAAPEVAGTTGETSGTKTEATNPGETISQQDIAPAAGGLAEVGADAADGVQVSADDPAGSAASVFPQLAGAKLFLDDRPAIPLSDVGVTLPELSEVATELVPIAPASARIELTQFERPIGLTVDPTEPLFSVRAPNGPRWRCGIQFGVSPQNMTGADLGADPEAFWEALSSDPHLRIGPPIDPE